MQRDLIINDRLSIPRSELHFTFARSAGPGGQNVNKVNTKAVLRWRPSESTSLPPAVLERLLVSVGSRLTRDGDLLITSDVHREQGRNVGDCLNRLKAMICGALRPPKKRRPTRRTKGSNERRLKEKRVNASKKANRGKPESES